MIKIRLKMSKKAFIPPGTVPPFGGCLCFLLFRLNRAPRISIGFCGQLTALS